MITCTFENGNTNSLRHAVVDVLVVKEDKILMVKRTKKLLEGGKWGLVSGFMERDETIKEAATREAFEESGWRISNIQLLTIRDNPDRPHEDRQNVAFVLTAHADKKDGEKDWESDEVKWFPFDELPLKSEIAFDHADNIHLYLQHRNDKINVPILE